LQLAKKKKQKNQDMQQSSSQVTQSAPNAAQIANDKPRAK